MIGVIKVLKINPKFESGSPKCPHPSRLGRRWGGAVVQHSSVSLDSFAARVTCDWTSCFSSADYSKLQGPCSCICFYTRRSRLDERYDIVQSFIVIVRVQLSLKKRKIRVANKLCIWENHKVWPRTSSLYDFNLRPPPPQFIPLSISLHSAPRNEYRSLPKRHTSHNRSQQ